MEVIINEQLKSLKNAIAGLETIKQLIYDSPIDDQDKRLFGEILSRAYKKGYKLRESLEARIKKMHKRVKYQPNHF